MLGYQGEENFPQQTDVTIIDGLFLLHTITVTRVTFEKLSKQVYSKIIQNQSQEIHIIFDQYPTASIKDYKRTLRNEFSLSRPFKITNNTPLPSNFLKELRNPQFEKDLVNFFINNWSSVDLVPFIGDKILFVNYEECHEFSMNDTNSGILKSLNKRLTCPSHEEADNKIIYHICHTNRVATFSFRCSDTDILIILLVHLHKINKESKIHILSGTQRNRLVINVTSLYRTLGPQ